MSCHLLDIGHFCVVHLLYKGVCLLRFRSSAFEHGIEAEQVHEVIANKWEMTKWFKIHDDIHGNSQDMIVGFDANGNLIEIGLTYIDNDEIIFHADHVTSAWIEIYTRNRLN